MVLTNDLLVGFGVGCALGLIIGGFVVFVIACRLEPKATPSPEPGEQHL